MCKIGLNNVVGLNAGENCFRCTFKNTRVFGLTCTYWNNWKCNCAVRLDSFIVFVCRCVICTSNKLMNSYRSHLLILLYSLFIMYTIDRTVHVSPRPLMGWRKTPSSAAVWNCCTRYSQDNLLPIVLLRTSYLPFSLLKCVRIICHILNNYYLNVGFFW